MDESRRATTTGSEATATPGGEVPFAPKALTTRYLDFWLLGGASILVWLVMFSTENLRDHWAIDQHFRYLNSTALSLALLVNYPHFLISYKLAYTRGPRFIVGYWWQLLVVPALLIALFAVAYAYFDVPVRRVGVAVTALQTVSPWGANSQVLAGPRVGDLLFTLAFNFMIFTIGWHYTKQVFGCMMVYAHYDQYPMTGAQRRLTKWALLSIWGMVFVDQNINGDFRAWRGFNYSSLDLPDIAGPLSQGLVFAGLCLVVYQVFYKTYQSTGRRPGVNMLVPFVALYLWWLPQTRQDTFFFLLVPLFHGLQYLAFAYRMESRRLHAVSHRDVRATTLVVGLVVGGWLAFEFVPDTIDAALGTPDAWQMFFFFTAAMLFINIHHYFIDNVLWRFRDPRVQAFLLN